MKLNTHTVREIPENVSLTTDKHLDATKCQMLFIAHHSFNPSAPWRLHSTFPIPTMAQNGLTWADVPL